MKAPDLTYMLNELLSAFSIVDFRIGLVIGLILLIGVLSLLIAVTRLWQRRLLAAGIRGFGGICCVSIAWIFLLSVLNFHTYYRLTHEMPLVKLTFSEQGARQFKVTLKYLNNDFEPEMSTKQYLLAGDEWQVDARVLRWKPVIQLFGFNALYRLERLNGRYSSVSDELSQPRTVYELAQDRGLDIWSLTKQYLKWVDWVDSYYGSAAYLPMANGAEYILLINQSGLIARPDNDIAREAVQTW